MQTEIIHDENKHGDLARSDSALTRSTAFARAVRPVMMPTLSLFRLPLTLQSDNSVVGDLILKRLEVVARQQVGTVIWCCRRDARSPTVVRRGRAFRGVAWRGVVCLRFNAVVRRRGGNNTCVCRQPKDNAAFTGVTSFQVVCGLAAPRSAAGALGRALSPTAFQLTKPKPSPSLLKVYTAIA